MTSASVAESNARNLSMSKSETALKLEPPRNVLSFAFFQIVYDLGFSCHPIDSGSECPGVHFLKESCVSEVPEVFLDALVRLGLL